jgi:hypothetical protein
VDMYWRVIASIDFYWSAGEVLSFTVVSAFSRGYLPTLRGDIHRA